MLSIRQKREKRRLEIIEYIRKREKALPKSPEGNASKYIYHLDEYLKQHPDIEALIYCRVSSGPQKYKCNLVTYEKVSLGELKKRGIPVVGCCYSEESSGWVLNDEREELINAIEEAKRLIKKGRKIVIVTASTNRFLRNRDFRTTERPYSLPTEADFQQLNELACGVPLVTLLSPDMSEEEVRSYQTKWGQEAKGNKGGRPEKKEPGYKKRRRIRKLDKVRQLHKQGTAVCDIERQTGIKRSTIIDWIAEI